MCIHVSLAGCSHIAKHKFAQMFFKNVEYILWGNFVWGMPDNAVFSHVWGMFGKFLFALVLGWGQKFMSHFGWWSALFML